MLPDNSNRVALAGAASFDPLGRFSPDDNRVLIMRYEKDTQKVCTADLDGGNVRFAYVETAQSRATSVGWSPDAKRLAMVLYDWQTGRNGQKTLIANVGARSRIAIVDLDGGNLRELTLENVVIQTNNLEWR